MYGAPTGQPSAATAIAKTSLPVIAAICCGATVLLLLASTIVLALIPIYIPQKSATKASTTSGLVSSYIPFGTSSGRKRETTDDVSSANGGVVHDSMLPDIKSKFLTIFKKSKKVQDMTGLSCTIVQLASSRRRRLAVVKRQTSGQTYLKCQYYVVLVSTLTTSSMQLAAATTIQALFESDSSIMSLFVFDNLLITYGGQTKGYKCKATGLGFIARFGPSGSQFSDDRVTIPPTGATVSSGIVG